MKLPTDSITVRKLRDTTHTVGLLCVSLRKTSLATPLRETSFATPEQKEKTNLPSTKRRK